MQSDNLKLSHPPPKTQISYFRPKFLVRGKFSQTGYEFSVDFKILHRYDSRTQPS